MLYIHPCCIAQLKGATFQFEAAARRLQPVDILSFLSFFISCSGSIASLHWMSFKSPFFSFFHLYGKKKNPPSKPGDINRRLLQQRMAELNIIEGHATFPSCKALKLLFFLGMIFWWRVTLDRDEVASLEPLVRHRESAQAHSPDAGHASSLRAQFASLQLTGDDLPLGLQLPGQTFKLQLLEGRDRGGNVVQLLSATLGVVSIISTELLVPVSPLGFKTLCRLVEPWCWRICDICCPATHPQKNKDIKVASSATTKNKPVAAIQQDSTLQNMWHKLKKKKWSQLVFEHRSTRLKLLH